MFNIFGKKLDKKSLEEVREVARIVNAEKYKLEIVKGNTALVKNSEDWIETQESLVNVLENQKEALLSQKLTEAGVPPGQPASIDLSNGKIKLE